MERKIKFIVPLNKKEYTVIGFDRNEDNSSFIFPCQYLSITNEDKQTRKEAQKIIRLIKRMKKEFDVGGVSEDLFQYYSMMWLMQDYMDRGYYTETEKQIVFNQKGKINWKQTIKNNSIYVDKGNIIYKDFAVYKNKIADNEIIAEIYKCCLYHSVSMLGWVFGISETEKSQYTMTSSNISFMVFFLKKELEHTFNDYKKTLIKNLLNILLAGNAKDKNNGLLISDSEFEYVFEYLINYVFGTEKVSEYYNRCEYHLINDNGNEERFSASPLRPDTVMKNKSDYYVIDAKYYDYGYTKAYRDMPQSSSITKQIGYKKYIEELLAFKLEAEGKNSLKMKTKAVFVLPFSKRDNDKIKYIGYALDKPIALQSKKYTEKVHICLVDLKTLVDLYFGECEITKEQLQQELVEVLKNKN